MPAWASSRCWSAPGGSTRFPPSTGRSTWRPQMSWPGWPVSTCTGGCWPWSTGPPSTPSPALPRGRDGCLLSRVSPIPRTWARCSARPPRWAWTGFWSTRPAPTRCTGGWCGSRWAQASWSRGQRLGRWPTELGSELASWATVALTPAAEAELDDSLRAAPRVAVLVGAEGPGLSPAALAAASHRVRIPMASGLDSLNVAVAAAVALWALSPS